MFKDIFPQKLNRLVFQNPTDTPKATPEAAKGAEVSEPEKYRAEALQKVEDELVRLDARFGTGVPDREHDPNSDEYREFDSLSDTGGKGRDIMKSLLQARWELIQLKDQPDLSKTRVKLAMTRYEAAKQFYQAEFAAERMKNPYLKLSDLWNDNLEVSYRKKMEGAKDVSEARAIAEQAMKDYQGLIDKSGIAREFSPLYTLDHHEKYLGYRGEDEFTDYIYRFKMENGRLLLNMDARSISKEPVFIPWS